MPTHSSSKQWLGPQSLPRSGLGKDASFGSTSMPGCESNHEARTWNTWRLLAAMTGKFSSLICAAKASVSPAIWSIKPIVFGSSLPSVAIFRCLMANFQVVTARAMSGQVSLLPPSHGARSWPAVYATKASGRPGGAQAFGAASQPSACSRPASDFRKKHFFSPSCSPNVQWVHSSSWAHLRAQMPLSRALNLSVLVQSFCQQPAEP
mmetsp:Transcript_100111/g.311307  ORF Transcript_100111/g.311307 Transcript_100111/m.311307 type:complete len:207 (+) Transcript_100111:144-764(+)